MIYKHIGNTYHYEPLKPTNKKLSSSLISELNFLITDQNDAPLHFAVGSATYLRLSFKNMLVQKKYLTLQSDDPKSLLYYRSNSNSHFTILLPTTLDVLHWSINLTTIHLPKELNNLRSNFNKILCEWVGQNNVHSTTIELRPSFYSSIEQLEDELNVQMHKWSDQITTNHTRKNQIRFTNSSTHEARMVINPTLSIILGFTLDMITENTSISIPSGESITSAYDVNLSITRPRYAKILCEQVNNNNNNLLKLIFMI